MSAWIYCEPTAQPTWFTPPAGADPHGRQATLQAFAAYVGGRVPYLPLGVQDVDALAVRFARTVETIAGLSYRFTLALEITVRPGLPPNQPALDVVVIGKAIGSNSVEAAQASDVLWRLCESAFPSEPPFLFPLARLTADALAARQQLIPGAVNIVGLRKHCDGGPTQGDSFPHPYRALTNGQTLMPLFAALAACPTPSMLTISLRPSGLPEVSYLEQLNHAVAADDSAQRIAAEQMALRYQPAANRSAAQESLLDRAAIGARQIEHELRRQRDRARETSRDQVRRSLAALVCEQLFRQRMRLLSMHVYLASFDGDLPPTLIQAVRMALAAPPIGDGALLCFEPPDIVASHTPALARILRYNAVHLEHRVADEEGRSARLCYTATPEEAAALFCLPTPAGFGETPGMAVRDEPFALPLELAIDKQPSEPPAAERKIEIGVVHHRGVPTALPADIPLSRFDQHLLIAGRSGSGKTNTCLHLLSQLWAAGVPFLVLDPLMKHDYRLLLGDPRLRDHLRVYTLGDPTTSSFTFNPFDVPPGVGVREHISQLLRCFVNAFATSDPLPTIYRAALYQAYLEADSRWDLDHDRGGMPRRMPTFASFYAVLLRIAEQRSKDYGSDVRGTIRQMTRNRIGSLLEDNYRILNTEPGDDRDPFLNIPDTPTIIEVARIGSDEDKALMMAFLLACLIPRMQHRADRRLHITLIEEAHRLMRGHAPGVNQGRGDSSYQASMEFANLLAEMRGFKQGIVVVDQSPAELVPSVLSNTATRIMHQVRDPASFEIMADTFVLNEAQRSYARRLPTGHAVSETSSGWPIHIVVTNQVGQLTSALRNERLPTGEPYLDENDIVRDAAVQEMMSKHATPMPTYIKPGDLFAEGAAAAERPSSALKGTAPRTPAPLLTCLYCRPHLEHGTCPHQILARQLRADKALKKGLDNAMANAAQSRKEALSISDFSAQMHEVWSRLPPAEQERVDAAYCFIAHTSQAIIKHRLEQGAITMAQEALAAYNSLLKTFHEELEHDLD